MFLRPQRALSAKQGVSVDHTEGTEGAPPDRPAERPTERPTVRPDEMQGARPDFKAEFDDFVVTRSPRLLRSAYLLTHDWATAEDLLQTALAKAWFAWRRLDANPEAYVRKIMFNTYASWWRRRSFAEHPSEAVDSPTVVDAHASVDSRDELWRALGRLPRRQRAVLVLRYFEDLTEAEIAETLEISTGTVKSQAAKALAKLRADSSLRPAGDPAGDTNEVLA